MNEKNYDEQFDRILDQIVGDFAVDLEDTTWSTRLPHEKIDRLLVEHHLLVVVTSKPDEFVHAVRECYTNVAALYEYLVLNLYTSVINESLEFSYYEAEDFLVLIFNGAAAPVVEAIGQVVMPFVTEHFHQDLPDRQQNQVVANRVLQQLIADQADATLRTGIIDRVNPLRIQQLQPLALTRMNQILSDTPDGSEKEMPEDQATESTPTTATLNREAQSDEAVSATDKLESEPTAPTNEAARSPDEVLLGRQPSQRRTAPLPGYFDRDSES